MARRALGSLSASSSVLRNPRLSSSVRKHAPWAWRARMACEAGRPPQGRATTTATAPRRREGEAERLPAARATWAGHRQQPRHDITSQNVTCGSERSAIPWDGHASMPRVWSGKRPGGAGTGWRCGPHYPSAAAKQAAYRARKRQAAQDLAARECAAIQQALQTRALADQCWELHALIDDWSRDADMPRQALARRAAPPGSWPARAPTFTGWPQRACAGIGGRSSAWRTSGPPGEPRRARRATRDADKRTGVCASPPPQGRCGDPVRRTWREQTGQCTYASWHKTRALSPLMCAMLIPRHAALACAT